MSGFDLKLKIDGIRGGDRIDLTAAAAARDQIAERLGLPGLDRLEAHAALEREGEEIRAKGRLRASLQQACVITGDPIAARIDEPFELLFRPEPDVAPDEEIELGPDDCDVVFHDGAAIDLGAAIADTLALAIDPYPRSAGADAALKEAGILSEAEAGPFAALAKLKRDLP
jgi:uncharacterized metal-binding protein YceD (DUF177 family)